MTSIIHTYIRTTALKIILSIFVTINIAGCAEIRSEDNRWTAIANVAKEKPAAEKPAARMVRTQYKVDLLEEPNLSSRPVTKLNVYSTLSVLSYNGKWLQVQTDSGQMGYVSYRWVLATGENAIATKAEIEAARAAAAKAEAEAARAAAAKAEAEAAKAAAAKAEAEAAKAAAAKAEAEAARAAATKEEIARIEKELKSIPVSEFDRNLNLYKKLVYLDPSNSEYKTKVKLYENKIEEAAAKAEEARAEEARAAAAKAAKAAKKKIASLKIKNIGLGLNNNIPCSPKDETYIDVVRTPVRLQYECDFGTEKDKVSVVFSADKKSVVKVIRKQYLDFGQQEQVPLIIDAAINYYGKPDHFSEGNWLANYGNAFLINSSGKVNGENQNGSGLIIDGSICGDGRYGTENCGNLGSFVIEYILVDNNAYYKSIEDGKKRLKGKQKEAISKQTF